VYLLSRLTKVGYGEGVGEGVAVGRGVGVQNDCRLVFPSTIGFDLIGFRVANIAGAGVEAGLDKVGSWGDSRES
jgi:hypothetical protein